MKSIALVCLIWVMSSLSLPALAFETLELSLEREDITLHGVIRLPTRPMEARDLVIVHAGSGPTDRDGNQATMRNDSLRLLAEGMAESGVAVLSYDKRGSGQTGMQGAEADLRPSTYINDLVAWVRWAESNHPELAIHLLGHSEGALFVKAASSQVEVASVISLAGAGRPAGVLLREQTAGRLPGTLADEFETALSSLERGVEVSEINPMLNALFRPSVQPYLIEWLSMNPATLAEAVNVRLLVISGSTDIQVSEADFQALASHADQADWIEGMNHVLKQAEGPVQAQMSSYTDPSMPLHDALLPILITWLNSE